MNPYFSSETAPSILVPFFLTIDRRSSGKLFCKNSLGREINFLRLYGTEFGRTRDRRA